MKLFVLWYFIGYSWSHGPIPLTAGWWSSKLIFDNRAQCVAQAREYMANLHRDVDGIVCMRAGQSPEPLAKLRH